MNVRDDRLHRCSEAVARKQISGGAERTIERVHIKPAHRLQHQRPPPAADLDDNKAAARCLRRIIQRAGSSRGGVCAI